MTEKLCLGIPLLLQDVTDVCNDRVHCLVGILEDRNGVATLTLPNQLIVSLLISYAI